MQQRLHKSVITLTSQKKTNLIPLWHFKWKKKRKKKKEKNRHSNNLFHGHHFFFHCSMNFYCNKQTHILLPSQTSNLSFNLCDFPFTNKYCKNWVLLLSTDAAHILPYFYYSWGFYNSLHFHSQFLLLVTGIISLFSWGSKQNIILVCLIIFDTRLIQWHKLCKSMLLLFFVCSTIHLKPFGAVVLALQSLKNSLNKTSEEKVDKWAKKYLLFVQLVANIQKAPSPQVIKEDSLNNLNIKNAFYYLNIS